MELRTLKEALASLSRRLEHGCGNTGCILMPPGGQRTNVGCSCDPYHISGELYHLRNEIERMVNEGNRWPDQPAAKAGSARAP